MIYIKRLLCIVTILHSKRVCKVLFPKFLSIFFVSHHFDPFKMNCAVNFLAFRAYNV